jgi:Arc/MetJ family transcription regulator
MRTTLDIPKDLLEEAQKVSGAKTKTTTVVLSLEKLIQSNKIEKLRALRGKLDLDIDLKRLRKDRTRH